MTPPPEPVRTPAEAEAFLRWCCAEIGVGFHPDTRFGDYVVDGGVPAFDSAEAARLDRLMAETFFVLPDPYAVCATLPPFRDVLTPTTAGD